MDPGFRRDDAQRERVFSTLVTGRRDERRPVTSRWSPPKTRGSVSLAADQLPHADQKAGMRVTAFRGPDPACRRIGGHRRTIVAMADDLVELPVGQLEKPL